MDNLESAFNYAQNLGWHVFPTHSIINGACSCAMANCQSPGKHPRTAHGLSDATTDPEIINRWWKAWPTANIGLATGAVSGVWVLDVDPRHGGDETLLQLQQEHGRTTPAVECLTGGGGRHLYFAYPTSGMIKSRNGFPGQGLDVKGDGGFVILPPSTHISGNRYEWEVSSDPQLNTPEPAPGWLLDLVQTETRTTQATDANGDSSVTAGGRNVFLTKRAGKLRRQGLSADEIEATLTVTNQQHCKPPLAADEVHKIAHSIARYQVPHVPTDDELAREWLRRNDNMAYGLGEFRMYTNGCWPAVSRQNVELEILGIMEHAKKDGYKPSSWKLKSIMYLAQVMCSVPDDRWNQDPDVLVCRNGTLHIPTMTLMSHDRRNYITAGVQYDYDKDAIAPAWTHYCNTRMGPAHDFLQEFAGYCLTIEVKYDTALWLWGPRGSGKSTYIEGLQAMLGTKAGLLSLKDLVSSRFALTGLEDKTLFVATEQPEMFVESTDMVNNLISGEKIKTERKFRDPVEIESRAKICWAMNTLPRIGESSSGIFRRVKIVKFEEVPVALRDVNVKVAIKQEGSGVLSWALIGLARLRSQTAFTIPDTVTEATEMFQVQNDVPALFMDERCVMGRDYWVGSNALYRAYRAWCDENGNRPQANNTITNDWMRLGLVRKKTESGMIWYGARLRG